MIREKPRGQGAASDKRAAGAATFRTIAQNQPDVKLLHEAYKKATRELDQRELRRDLEATIEAARRVLWETAPLSLFEIIEQPVTVTDPVTPKFTSRPVTSTDLLDRAKAERAAAAQFSDDPDADERANAYASAALFKRFLDSQAPARQFRPGRRDYATIKANTDILELVGRYTGLRRRGAKFVALCCLPGHQERTPSLTIWPDQQKFHCFGCGKGGDVIDFMRLVGLEVAS